MSVDELLPEISPIFRKTSQGFAFTTQVFREVLAAKHLANNVNSGDIPIPDLVDGLEHQQFSRLPLWEIDAIVGLLFELLNQTKKDGLIKHIGLHDPHYVEFCGVLDSGELKEIVRCGCKSNFSTHYSLRDYVNARGQHITQEGFGVLIRHRDNMVLEPVMRAMARFKQFHPYLMHLVEKGRYSMPVMYEAIKVLGAVGQGVEIIRQYASEGWASAVAALWEMGEDSPNLDKVVSTRYEAGAVIVGLDAIRRSNRFHPAVYQVVDYDDLPLSGVEDEDWDHDWESRHVGVSLVALEVLCHFKQYDRVVQKITEKPFYLSHLGANLDPASAKGLLLSLEKNGLDALSDSAFGVQGVALLAKRAEEKDPKKVYEDRSWPHFYN